MSLLLLLHSDTTLYQRNTVLNGQTRGGAALLDLLTVAGASVDTAVTNTTVAGTEIPLTKTAGGSPAGWITPPFATAVTITGADIAAWFSESTDLINVGGRFRLYRWRAGVETEFVGSPADDGVEFTTVAALYTWAATLTPLDFIVDDRLLLVPALINVGVMTMGTATLRFNGSVGALTTASVGSSSHTTGTGVGSEPTGTAENDILVAYVNSDTAVSTPVGWTAHLSQPYNNAEIAVFSIKRGASAPALTWTSGSAFYSIDIQRVINADQTTWIDTAPVSTSAVATTTPSSPSITTTQANSLLLVYLATFNTPRTITVPSGFTQDTNSSADATASANKLQTSAGASGTHQWTINTADDAASITVAIRSALAGSSADSYLNVYPAIEFKAEAGGGTTTVATKIGLNTSSNSSKKASSNLLTRLGLAANASSNKKSSNSAVSQAGINSVSASKKTASSTANSLVGIKTANNSQKNGTNSANAIVGVKLNTSAVKSGTTTISSKLGLTANTSATAFTGTQNGNTTVFSRLGLTSASSATKKVSTNIVSQLGIRCFVAVSNNNATIISPASNYGIRYAQPTASFPAYAPLVKQIKSIAPLDADLPILNDVKLEFIAPANNNQSFKAIEYNQKLLISIRAEKSRLNEEINALYLISLQNKRRKKLAMAILLVEMS